MELLLNTPKLAAVAIRIIRDLFEHCIYSTEKYSWKAWEKKQLKNSEEEITASRRLSIL